MRLLNLKSLSNVDMISYFYPIPNFFLHYLLLIFAINFFVFFQSENSVLLFKNWIRRDIKSVERMLLQRSSIDGFVA